LKGVLARVRLNNDRAKGVGLELADFAGAGEAADPKALAIPGEPDRDNMGLACGGLAVAMRARAGCSKRDWTSGELKGQES